MASFYKVSADTSEKEKAVGGILTFGQAGWLVLGILICAVIFISLANLIPPLVSLIIAIPPGAIFGCMFAFYRKEQLPLCTYLVYQYNFKKKSHHMINDLAYGKTFQKEDELFQ